MDGIKKAMGVFISVPIGVVIFVGDGVVHHGDPTGSFLEAGCQQVRQRGLVVVQCLHDRQRDLLFQHLRNQRY